MHFQLPKMSQLDFLILYLYTKCHGQSRLNFIKRLHSIFIRKRILPVNEIGILKTLKGHFDSVTSYHNCEQCEEIFC